MLSPAQEEEARGEQDPHSSRHAATDTTHRVQVLLNAPSHGLLVRVQQEPQPAVRGTQASVSEELPQPGFHSKS